MPPFPLTLRMPEDVKVECPRLVSARTSLEGELIASGGEEVLLTEARKTVLKQRPLQLLQKLKEGTFTAVETLEAFQAKVSA